MLIIIGMIVIATMLNLYLWKRRPNEGQIVITTDYSGKKTFSLELDKTPQEIEKMNRVSFKVVSAESQNEVMDLLPDEIAE